jgi:drug/metabolite transporter (DMT)-like permease
MLNGTARLQALAAALLFSTGGAGIKAAAFSAAQVSGMRSAVAAIALYCWLRGRITWSWTAAGIGLVYAATLTLFVASTKLTTAANAIYLQATAPLYLLMLGPLLLRERVTRGDIVYVCCVGAGMAGCFVGQPPATATAPDPATGNILAVLCSVAWAFTLLSLRYVERDGKHAGIGVSAVVTGNLFAAALALPFAWPFPAATVVEWGTLIYLGVFEFGLAYLCLTSAMRHLPVLDASLLLLLEPVLNPVWTWLIRGEHPGTWTLVGGAVILAATAGKTVYDARRPARATERTETAEPQRPFGTRETRTGPQGHEDVSH